MTSILIKQMTLCLLFHPMTRAESLIRAGRRGRQAAEGSGQRPQQLGVAPEQLNLSSLPPDMATEAGD